jgi:glycosyltransferase involved in cell wall biosynthesis
MPGIIAACNAYVVPLRKIDIFRGAIPSKLFEPLAMGKPIILGVEGEAKDLFIDKGRCGLFYEPENSENLAQCIISLYKERSLATELGANGKNYVMKNFARHKIAKEFLDELNKYS